MSEVQTYGHHIGGEVVDGGVDVLDHTNPADNRERVAKSYVGHPDQMNQAVDAAGRAFEGWAETTAYLRGAVLFEAANLLREPRYRVAFITAMVSEIGKTIGGASGEVAKTFKILQYMAGLPTHTRNEVFHGDQPGVDMYGRSEPVGVAGLVTPFNFPLAVTVWKVAAALAAGCTAVIKPSPYAPMTSTLIMQLFNEAMARVESGNNVKFPKGVINMVLGGPDVVSALVQNQLTKALSFTGSTPVGKSLLRQAMTREGEPMDPRHFVAEMGGHNPILVLADANLDMAASAATAGFAVGEGQRCTATKRILVDVDVADEFLDRFLAEVRELIVGPGRNPETDVGPLISRHSLGSVLGDVTHSTQHGMDVLAGGRWLTSGSHEWGNFMEPTVLKGDYANPDHLPLRREIFGPVAGVGFVQGFEEGLAAVNDSTHAHVASVFTQDPDVAAAFVRRAKAGMVHVNNTTLGGDAQAPFGGLGGDTSLGLQEMGPHAMDPFLKHKTVGWNHSGKVLGGRAR